MGLSFLLTILAAIGWVEDLYPWLKTLHPVGVLLFFAWFLCWNWWEVNLECGAGTLLAGSTAFKAQAEPLAAEPAVSKSGNKSPHSKSPRLVFLPILDRLRWFPLMRLKCPGWG